MTKAEKEVLYEQLIDFCYNKCEYQECIECQKNGKLNLPFCKVLNIDDAYQVIDTKTLSCDLLEILKDIRLDFYKSDTLAHSINIITELVENERYKITKRGDV